MVLGFLFSLIRPIRFFLQNPSDPLPPWDPVFLFRWMPTPSAPLVYGIFALAILFGLLTVALGARRRWLWPVCGFAFLTLALQHGFKYMHHRDGLLALAFLILPLYPVRSTCGDQKISGLPIVIFCGFWSLLFFSSGLQKVLSPDEIWANPYWILEEVNYLLALGWQVNPLWVQLLNNLKHEAPWVLAVFNFTVLALELGSGLFFLTGAAIWGALGLFLLILFYVLLGIGFWEVAVLFPAWILLYRMKKAAGGMGFNEIR